MAWRQDAGKDGHRRPGMMPAACVWLACLAAGGPDVSAQSAQSAPARVTILVYDASGSMWGPLPDGGTKVEAARDVIGGFFASRDTSAPLGVVAYGHNRRGDCADIEVVAPVAVHDAGVLSARLNRISPVGMTPLSAALQRAAGEIPATAESADIILVTDGLETCDADPCAAAADLAAQGIRIRAHVVGFGLTAGEAETMSCVAEATGGLLLTPQSGQELADSLAQIAQLEPPSAAPAAQAFFNIGPQAEAGHTYQISYQGTVPGDYYVGFAPRAGGRQPASASFGVVGGSADAGQNPVSRAAPDTPGDYDLIMIAQDSSVIARQAIEVVPASNHFDAIGMVAPDQPFSFTWRGPDLLSQRIVIAQPHDPPGSYQDWDYALHKNGKMRLRAPAEPGVYELRYLLANGQEILFSRQFGVGVPFQEDAAMAAGGLTDPTAAAWPDTPVHEVLPPVRASFQIPEDYPQVPLWWSALPLDPGMSPDAWAPVAEMVVARGEFEPGRYRVSALAPGEVEFSASVEIRSGQDNHFVIGLADQRRSDSDADGFSEPAVIVCSGQRHGCAYSDPDTGLALTVPEGWSMTQPQLYRTAAGVIVMAPSARLFRQHQGVIQVLELNPRQWLQSSGPCVDIADNRLCHDVGLGDLVAEAIATVRASLVLTPASAP